MLAAQPDPKAATVLKPGCETFLQFGLRRASMQDITDRTGMSRAVLYLHFRNKDNIYTAMKRAYFSAATDAVEEALTGHQDSAHALTAAFEAQIGDAGEGLMRSAHAQELLSDKHAKTADGVKAIAKSYARRHLARVYARALATVS